MRSLSTYTLHVIETLICLSAFVVIMSIAMDRDFEDDPFRKMERKKAAKMAGIPESVEVAPDIEAPIVPQADQ